MGHSCVFDFVLEAGQLWGDGYGLTATGAEYRTISRH